MAVNVEQLLSPNPGGVGRYTAKLVEHLSHLGVEVHPVVARHSAEEVQAAWREWELADVPQPVRLSLPRPLLYDSWHLLGRPALDRGSPVDVIHAPSLAVPPKGGSALVVNVHDAAPWLYPATFTARGRWFHHAGMRAAARRADVVLTGTQAAAAELVAHTPLSADRVRVVPYGVDQPHHGPGPEVVLSVLARHGLSDRPYVLWVGSLEPRKGVGTLVAALARLTKGADADGPGWAVVLVGPPGWRNQDSVDPSDVSTLGPALRRLGRVPEGELRALYAGASVFAFPSLHEGFGLPVLEAMVAGVPVVASDIAALREVCGGAAQLVAPGDVAAWAEALQDVLASPARQAELAGSGRRRAAQFSWRATAQATIDIYQEVAR